MGAVLVVGLSYYLYYTTDLGSDAFILCVFKQVLLIEINLLNTIEL